MLPSSRGFPIYSRPFGVRLGKERVSRSMWKARARTSRSMDRTGTHMEISPMKNNTSWVAECLDMAGMCCWWRVVCQGFVGEQRGLWEWEGSTPFSGGVFAGGKLKRSCFFVWKGGHQVRTCARWRSSGAVILVITAPLCCVRFVQILSILCPYLHI